MNECLRLDECCQIEISSIDKKAKSNEEPVKLCNFTDVYRNWNIYSSMIDSFMDATASKKNIDTFSLNHGDVVITKDSETRDDIGMSALIYDDLPNTVLGYHCALIRPKKLITGSFLNAYLNSYLGRKYFENQASGSGQRYTLTKEALGSILIPMLPMEQQTVIGNFFSDIDKKIKTNNEIISELESLTKTIYDYWFLQFEFPNEDGKPYKSSGGKMVWNEELKREIPDGWNMYDIQDCCEIIDCLHSKKPEYNYDNEDSYLLTLDNLTLDGNIDLSKKYYISTRDFLKWTSKITVSENDFVVTNAGRAGDVCKIPVGVKCAIGRNITAIRPVKIDPYYLRQYFKSGYFSQQVKKNLDCGSFFKSFNVKSIKVLKILMPKASIYNTYIDSITPMIQTIESKTQENQELASLRDFLLPMLMNGQVTFKD